MELPRGVVEHPSVARVRLLVDGREEGQLVRVGEGVLLQAVVERPSAVRLRSVQEANVAHVLQVNGYKSDRRDRYSGYRGTYFS